jgi:phosphate:Na+ symporter
MTLAAALAVMLGADVGTTLVVQLLSFNISWLTPMLIVLGFTIFTMYHESGKMEHVGKFLIGLGLMLLSLSLIKSAAAPLQDSQALKDMVHALDEDPILAIIVTALITWIAHSSLAIVLFLASFVVAGVLPVPVGLVMVLGANIGGLFGPLVATIKSNREGARVSLGNLLTRICGVVIALPLLGVFHDYLYLLGREPAHVIINFHTYFNIGLSIVFMPLIGIIARVCQILIPDRKNVDDPGLPKYLDDKQLAVPSVALSAAMRETLRMADIVQSMLEDTILALQRNDERFVREIRERDDLLDKIYKAVKMYMARIARKSLDKDEAHKYLQILGFSTNIENVGDTIDKSLMEMARKKIKDKTHFSEKGWGEIKEIHSFVLDTVRLAQSVFVSGDPHLARQLVEGKERLRAEEVKVTAAHLERIREGIPETIATSSLHLDIIRDLRRINSYMASVAYQILEGTGELHESRLRPSRKEREHNEASASAAHAAAAANPKESPQG